MGDERFRTAISGIVIWLVLTNLLILVGPVIWVQYLVYGVMVLQVIILAVALIAWAATPGCWAGMTENWRQGNASVSLVACSHIVVATCYLLVFRLMGSQWITGFLFFGSLPLWVGEVLTLLKRDDERVPPSKGGEGFV